jgi:hypothetical protein
VKKSQQNKMAPDLQSEGDDVRKTDMSSSKLKYSEKIVSLLHQVTALMRSLLCQNNPAYVQPQCLVEGKNSTL